MASRKNSREKKAITPIRDIEGIFIQHTLETQPEKTSGTRKTRLKQKTDMEKAFEMQDKGLKNALSLF
jgi:hypothetical protein